MKSKWYPRYRNPIKQHLSALATGHKMPRWKDVGLCAEMDSKFGCGWDDGNSHLYGTWEHWSGSYEYPVGGAHEFMDTNNLWVGKSGHLRRDLCQHLLDNWSDH